MPQENLLRLPEVVARVGYGRSTLYAMIKRGQFPSPVSLGLRAVAWPSSQIDAWIHQKIEQGRDAAKPAPVKRRGKAQPIETTA